MKIEDFADIVFGTSIPNDSYVLKHKRKLMIKYRKIDPDKDPRYQDTSEVVDEIFSDNRHIENYS